MTRSKFSETEGRRLVQQRAAGWCEACGAPNPTDWSHRKARSQLGQWAPSNGLHLCNSCHTWCHAHPYDAQAKGWMVRSGHEPEDVPALLYTIIGPQWTLLDNAGGYTREIDPDTFPTT